MKKVGNNYFNQIIHKRCLRSVFSSFRKEVRARCWYNTDLPNRI